MKTAILAFLSLALLCATVQAAIVTIPTGLNPGDQYRLAFVTSGTRNATSLNINDYNDFVQSAADAVPELASLGATWKAIASTAVVDARDNTDTNPLSATYPIFLLNGTKLVDAGYDLWDGSIATPFNITQHGTIVPPDPGGVAAGVWTGTLFDGTRATGPGLGTLGDPSAVAGVAVHTTGAWVHSIPWATDNLRRLYAMSTFLTVPEPTTCTLALLGLFLMSKRRF